MTSGGHVGSAYEIWMMMVGVIVTAVTLSNLVRTGWRIRKQGWRQQIQNMRVSKIETCGTAVHKANSRTPTPRTKMIGN